MCWPTSGVCGLEFLFRIAHHLLGGSVIDSVFLARTKDPNNRYVKQLFEHDKCFKETYEFRTDTPSQASNHGLHYFLKANLLHESGARVLVTHTGSRLA